MDTAGQNRTKLTGRQCRFVECLLESPSVTAAAERCGIARSTAHAWLKSSDVRAELDRAQRSAFDAAISRIASLSAEAANKLALLVRSDNEAIALGAVRLVLESAGAHVDARELAAKLADIEERLTGARP
jgi:hypothetical protein